jgi:hypothetical protein
MKDAPLTGKLSCAYPTPATHRRDRMELGIALTLSDPPDAQPLQDSKGQHQFSHQG